MDASDVDVDEVDGVGDDDDDFPDCFEDWDKEKVSFASSMGQGLLKETYRACTSRCGRSVVPWRWRQVTPSSHKISNQEVKVESGYTCE